MSDLLERLEQFQDDWPAQDICREAHAEIERLRAALKDIADMSNDLEACAYAHAALNGQLGDKP